MDFITENFGYFSKNFPGIGAVQDVRQLCEHRDFTFFYYSNMYSKLIFYRYKMKGYKNLREAIIRAHDRGKTQREIADFLGIALGTVNKAIKRF